MIKETLWAFPMGNPEQGGYDGMTLRDWFAGQALIGLLSNTAIVARESWMPDPREEMAINAYRYADAMLRARRALTNSEGGGE